MQPGRLLRKGVVLLGLFVLVTLTGWGLARLDAAWRMKIQTPFGIDQRAFVDLGGAEQLVWIRSERPTAPVLIFLHGGPGFPLTYLAYRFQPPLETDYTVVHWEQRGSGRTFYRNPHVDSAAVDVATLVADLDHLVTYLKHELGPRPVVLLGQSWGSVLALHYLRARPGRVDAYVGVGQVVDFDAGKRLAAETALAQLPQDHPDAVTLRAALATLADARRIEDLDVALLELLITRSIATLPQGRQLSGLQQVWLGLRSPQLSMDDARWFLRASDTADIFALQRTLADHLYFAFDASLTLPSPNVPMCFVQGEHDWITPTPLVVEWADQLGLPAKTVQLVPGAGHTPFLDDPEAFAEALRRCDLVHETDAIAR